MVDVNEVPYGALYSFQPDYMDHLVHDEYSHEGEIVDEHTGFWLIITKIRDLWTRF